MRNYRSTHGSKGKLADMLAKNSSQGTRKSSCADTTQSKPKIALPELSKLPLSTQPATTKSTQEDTSTILATATSMNNQIQQFRNTSSSQVLLTEPNLIQYVPRLENFSNIVLTENSEVPVSDVLRTEKNSPLYSNVELDFHRSVQLTQRNRNSHKSISISKLPQVSSPSLYSHTRNTSLNTNLKEKSEFSKTPREKTIPQNQKKQQSFAIPIKPFDAKVYTTPQTSKVSSPRLTSVIIKNSQTPKNEKQKEPNTNSALGAKKLEGMKQVYKKSSKGQKIEPIASPPQIKSPRKVSLTVNTEYKQEKKGTICIDQKEQVPIIPLNQQKQLSQAENTNIILNSNVKTEFTGRLKIDEDSNLHKHGLMTPAFSKGAQNKLNELVSFNLSPMYSEPKSTAHTFKTDTENQLNSAQLLKLDISPFPGITIESASPEHSGNLTATGFCEANQLDFLVNSLSPIKIDPLNQIVVAEPTTNPIDHSEKPTIKINYENNDETPKENTLLQSPNQMMSIYTFGEIRETSRVDTMRGPASSGHRHTSILQVSEKASTQAINILRIPLPVDDSFQQEDDNIIETQPEQDTKQKRITSTALSAQLFNILENSQDDRTVDQTHFMKKKTKSKHKKKKEKSIQDNDLLNLDSIIQTGTPYFQDTALKKSSSSKKKNKKKDNLVFQPNLNCEIQNQLYLGNPIEFTENIQSPVNSVNSKETSPKNLSSPLKSAKFWDQFKNLGEGKSIQDKKRRVSLLRSVIKEEEGLQISFERRTSIERRSSHSLGRGMSGESSSIEISSQNSIKRESVACIPGINVEGRKTSIFKAQRLSLVIPNLENVSQPENQASPLLSLQGKEMIKKVSAYKSAMLKSKSSRQIMIQPKKKQAITLNSGDIASKLKFSGNKSKVTYKKSSEIMTGGANLKNDENISNKFLKQLNSVGQTQKDDSTPFAGRSIIAESKEVSDKQQVIDFSTLLKRYDEHSPMAAEPSVKTKQGATPKNLQIRANSTARRDTKIMINIVPPSQDLAVDQDEKQNKGAKDKQFEFVVKSDKKRPSISENGFSLFENFEDFGAKEFNVEIYLGGLETTNKKMMWSFLNYFSSDNNETEFFKYYEQIVLKKFPFLVNIYDEKLMKYEEVIMSQSKESKNVSNKPEKLFQSIPFELNFRFDTGEESQQMMNGILSTFYANKVIQGNEGSQVTSPVHVDDLEAYEKEINSLNVQVSLPRQAAQLKQEKVAPFYKNLIISNLPETVFEIVFKQDYLTFDHYLALDEMNVQPFFLNEPITMKGIGMINLDFISKLMLKQYKKVLKGTFGHQYFITNVVNTPYKITTPLSKLLLGSTKQNSESKGGKDEIIEKEDKIKPKKILKSSKSNGEINAFSKNLTFEKSKPQYLSSKSTSQPFYQLRSPTIMSNSQRVEESNLNSNKEIDNNSLKMNKMLTMSENQANDISGTGSEENRLKGETPRRLVKYIKSHDFNKVTTLPEKSGDASSQSSKHYENFQKISTAPSEFLQIPTFLSDEPNPTNPTPQTLTVQFEKDQEKVKENKEKIKLGSTKKLKSFVNRNIIKKKETTLSNETQHLIPSITLTKDENNKEKLYQAIKKFPFLMNKEKSRRILITKPKEDAPLAANPEDERITLRATGNRLSRNRAQNPLEQFFIYIKENRGPELIEFFLTYPLLFVDSTDEEGNYPLGIAAQSGFQDIAAILIQKGANLNSQNRDGNTALHLALAFSHFKVSDQLILAGASQNIQNKNRKTPWELVL